MPQLLEWLSRLFSSWKFWVVVAPWDVGVRVRLGKRAVALNPGPHLRVPFVDEITLVNTRVRVSGAPPVTIAAGDGKARVVSPTIGFRIADPLLAMQRFEHPEVVVLSYAQAEASKAIKAGECYTALAEEFAGSGIEILFVRYTEDVEVRAFRLMSSDWRVSDNMGGGKPDGRY